MDYIDFLNKKRHSVIDQGCKPVYIPSNAFDFQKAIIEKCMLKGRHGGFIDTGLGKTLIELSIAQNYAQITNKRVLIITPLAVAYQFIDEAAKFDICDPRYSKEGKLESDVVICNYERLDKFNPEDFGCVILDESSILKNFDGRIKGQITAFLKRLNTVTYSRLHLHLMIL